jgi:ankyrin repeat protein
MRVLFISLLFPVYPWVGFLEQMISACGGAVDSVEGKEDLRIVKKLLSLYPSLLNEDLDGDGFTPLIMATMCNSTRVVEFLLSLEETEVNIANRSV